MARTSEKRLKKEMTDYLCKLVSCDTTNPPGNEYLCVPILEKMMEDLGMEIIIKAKDKKRPNLIGRIGKGKLAVALVGHTDVVPAGTDWKKTEPFVPTATGSKVYGRGAEDDKGGFVAIWAAIKIFLSKHQSFSGRIDLIAAADEEQNSKFGIDYLLKSGYKADFALIPDAGPMKELIIGEKGLLWVRIKSYGKQAHGSTPSRGINAAENLAQLLLVLKKTDWEKGDSKDFKPTTYNLGVFKAGEVPNIVPGQAIAEVDFRRPTGVSKEDLLTKIEKAIRIVKKESPKASFALEILQESEPHLVEKNNKLVQAFLSAAKSLRIRIGTKTIGGNTVGKFFNLAGIPAIVHYPATSETAHMVDEFVDIDELYQGAKLYAVFLEKMLIKYTHHN